jgi:hypothetical protein
MKKQMVEIFVTSDGQRYESEKDAISREKFIRLEAFVDKHGFSGMDKLDVTQMIFDNEAKIVGILNYNGED